MRYNFCCKGESTIVRVSIGATGVDLCVSDFDACKLMTCRAFDLAIAMYRPCGDVASNPTVETK